MLRGTRAREVAAPDIDSPAYRRGWLDGETWAWSEASYEQLDRLQALGGRFDRAWRIWVRDGAAQEVVPRQLGAACGEGPQAARAFWSHVTGSDWDTLTRDPDYISGFVSGALEIYVQMVAQLGHA